MSNQGKVIHHQGRALPPASVGFRPSYDALANNAKIVGMACDVWLLKKGPFEILALKNLQRSGSKLPLETEGCSRNDKAGAPLSSMHRNTRKRLKRRTRKRHRKGLNGRNGRHAKRRGVAPTKGW